MALEDIEGAGKYLGSLNSANPASSDDRREGDNHLRGIKNTILNTFPNVNAEVTATAAELNRAAASDPATKANKAGDTFTGMVKADGVPFYSFRTGYETLQGLYCAGDAGQLGGTAGAGGLLQSRSQASNAKPLIVEATTDAAHTAPSGGAVAILLRVLGVTLARLWDTGRLVLGNAGALIGSALLQVNGSLSLHGSGSQIVNVPGSLTAPAYSFEGALGVGLILSGGTDLAEVTGGSVRRRLDAAGNNIIQVQTTPPALASQRQMVFNLISDTQLRISVRGSDGTTRVANLTLA